MVRSSPPLSSSTSPVPVRPITFPPMVKGPELTPLPEPEPAPEPAPEPEPEPEPELAFAQTLERDELQLDPPQPTRRAEAIMSAIKKRGFISGFTSMFCSPVISPSINLREFPMPRAFFCEHRSKPRLHATSCSHAAVHQTSI